MSGEPPQPYAIITVTEPILHKSSNQNTPSYVTYLVSGRDPHGQFHIRRRFREFLLLRNKFVERFIGMYIPPIPSKKTSGNIEDRQVQQRRRFLNYFSLKIAIKPYLFDSDIFQTFIRGDPDFQRASKKISIHEYALLTNIYEIQYKQKALNLDISQITIELERQGQILRQIQKKLSFIQSQFEEVLEAKKAFLTQYAECYKNILPRFQKEFVQIHGHNKDQLLLSQNQRFKQAFSEYLEKSKQSSLYDYIETIGYDIRQARALLQAIQTRKTFEAKKNNYETAYRQSKTQLQRLKSGRMSIKSLFTSGSKENQIKQLQNYVPQYQKNEVFVSTCLPLSAISIHEDILQFKKSRSINYLATMQIIAQKQIKMLTIYGEMLIIAQIKYYPKPFFMTSSQIENIKDNQSNSQNISS